MNPLKHLPETGRYVGDYATIFTYNAAKTNKYTVNVYRWDYAPNRQDSEKLSWCILSPILAKFSSRSFKSFDRAMKYRSKVVACADKEYLGEKVYDAVEVHERVIK